MNQEEATVLIVDDDPDFCYSLARNVRKMGHKAVSCGTITEGRRLSGEESVDAVFLDVNLPDGNGLDFLPELSRLSSSPEIIIITGVGDMNGAELAISNGAWDYINKSISAKDISLILKRALQYRHERLQAAQLSPTVSLRRDSIIGSSPAISQCLDRVAQCGSSDVNVLITGETGTGKELFARVIHDNSTRQGSPFVIVDCASLPESLAESILFGYKKGSFTGADGDRQGLIAKAKKGTLFLDEIGELPLETQKVFLRVLQERRMRPVGENREVECDFRLVAATNRNLEGMVEQGAFRKDLLFRINSVNIRLPPLRERTGDVQAIANFHFSRLCEKYGVEQKGISTSFFDCLGLYPWTGNVRELVNILEQSLLAAGQEPTLYPTHLPINIRILAKQAAISADSQQPVKGTTTPSHLSNSEIHVPLNVFRESVYKEAEKHYLTTLMEQCKGNIQEAMRISELSQSRLYALLQKYSLRSRKK